MRSFLVVLLVGLLACISAVSARPAVATHKIVYADTLAAIKSPPRNDTTTSSTTNSTAECNSSLWPIKHAGKYTAANCTLEFNSTVAACKQSDVACNLAAADRLATCTLLCHPPNKTVAKCSSACATNWAAFETRVCKPIKNALPAKACAVIAADQLWVCQHVCANLSGNSTTVAAPPGSASMNATRVGNIGDGGDTTTTGHTSST
ncbi:hypothetical protein HDU87_006052 [Geranomyces variabilis]|uniref:Uncharacterized protein n=1 Tax=Geranomyces variabilis TaxID=109894 RepID=A0AAD5TQZ4_9FUNG|nr:hypothetical protein HDU87_006052 [Geranomyces variabilis]